MDPPWKQNAFQKFMSDLLFGKLTLEQAAQMQKYDDMYRAANQLAAWQRSARSLPSPSPSPAPKAFSQANFHLKLKSCNAVTAAKQLTLSIHKIGFQIQKPSSGSSSWRNAREETRYMESS
jgi:hypothetical protein